MNYKDCISIKPRLASTWLVEFADGTIQLLILDKEFTVERVVDYVKTYNPRSEFEITMIDVGHFVVDTVINSFTPDGRKVNQDMCVSV